MLKKIVDAFPDSEPGRKAREKIRQYGDIRIYTVADTELSAERPSDKRNEKKIRENEGFVAQAEPLT